MQLCLYGKEFTIAISIARRAKRHTEYLDLPVPAIAFYRSNQSIHDLHQIKTAQSIGDKPLQIAP
jgi:hypothetical protein